MKTFNLLIAPDFSPQHFAGWHFLNTALQKSSNQKIHLISPHSAKEQLELIDKGDIDIIYANPFDASHLVRNLNYKAIAYPINKYDEIVIASSNTDGASVLEDLKAGDTVIMADNKDVKLIGLRLLEGVDLKEEDLNWEIAENYQSAARQVVEGKVAAGFFLAESFYSFNKLTRSRLNVLIESSMEDIMHIFLVREKNEELLDISAALIELKNDPSKTWVLKELGIPDGFAEMDQEDTEFMIDIIETLID